MKITDLFRKRKSASKDVENKKKSKFAIEMKNVTKTFLGGKIIANSNVNISVKWNEIHALCGENGAGKSTLMSILFGLYKQDSGTVYVAGKKVDFKNAMQANNAGLGMVHQHFKLVMAFDLLQNITLGAETTRHGLLYSKPAKEKINQICNKYGFKIDLHQKTSEATVGTQQKVEIIKLLYRGAEILIFDEPTAVLSDDEIAGFLDMLRTLKKQGKTIILISHKLNEVLDVADTITVLRKGVTVGTYPRSEIDTSKLVELIVGRKMIENTNMLNFENKLSPIIRIEHIKMHKQNDKNLTAIYDLSLTVNSGEIVGIAGIEGNGQSELALALAGIQHPDKGKIFFTVSGLETDITKEKPGIISNLGLSHVPEDRHKYGCILDETVAFNLISNQINNKLYNRFGFLKMKEISMNANNLCTRFNVLGANKGRARFRSLSGGNQQKVVVARELSKPHSVIVMVQPTRGLDIGAINSIHDYILEESKKGKAVILISYELDEILKIASRVVVMDHGKIVYDGLKTKTDRQTIGKFLMRTGGTPKDTATKGGN
ncbi:MAG: ABC transporter ATP-binding protein [Mycoplasma sp.]|nr:ABC transporter ATP-binding protein [Candidatus Hennigella equi]